MIISLSPGSPYLIQSPPTADRLILSMDSATVTSPERSSLLQPRKETQPPVICLQSPAFQCVAVSFDYSPVNMRLFGQQSAHRLTVGDAYGFKTQAVRNTHTHTC